MPVMEGEMTRERGNRASLARVDVVEDEMARVLAAKTGAERLAIANGMFRAARRMIASHLRSRHPTWGDPEIERETARRLARGSG
jgi:hypothetical protein